jgi:hypothetical protein
VSSNRKGRERKEERTLVLVQACSVEASFKDLHRVEDEPRADFGEGEVSSASLRSDLLRLRVGDGGGSGGGSLGKGVGGGGVENLCGRNR